MLEIDLVRVIRVQSQEQIQFMTDTRVVEKRKEMQKLLDGLSVGDEVLTNGGIAGRISKLPENKEYVLISVADGIVIQMKRNYIVAVLPKGTLVATGAESK